MVKQTAIASIDLAHSGFAVLRTPLLPVEELNAWSEGLTAAAAWQRTTDSQVLRKCWENDVRMLRSRLQDLVQRPEILHALFVASPSLASAIGYWKDAPESKKGLQAERAVVRYFARMSGRSTPFGIFSGCSLAKLEDNSDASTLTLRPRSQYRIFCRLDFDYLFALTTVLQQEPNLEAELNYWPNSTLSKIADAWHYTESRIAGNQRTHHLVRLESDPYLEAVLDKARTGATLTALVDAVLNAPGDVNPSEEEAKEYVLELIRGSNVLVSRLCPVLTGTPPLQDIITQAESLPSGRNIAILLRGVQRQIGNIECKGLLSVPSDYEAITSQLKSLTADIDISKLYQVDMTKPVTNAVLGQAVISELTRGVAILSHLCPAQEPEELKLFRDAFLERYGSATVSLMEAVDDESGVGFGLGARVPDASPLLRGLRFGAHKGETGDQSDSQTMLMQQLFRRVQQGDNELELDISNMLSNQLHRVTLAEAFSVTASISAVSASAIEAGDFELYLHSGTGPSGARLLGRFCYTDPALEHAVRMHLRQEESHHPDTIYAEIVYLPEGRIGNVLCRPVVRDCEIPYMARSGASDVMCIPIQDLVVSVKDGTIVLYSERLQRRVLPRLTNAHGFINPQLPSVYRFLCYLQHQHGQSGPGFSWGRLESLDFLPRIRAGRLVLALARWRISEGEIHSVAELERSESFFQIQQLRRRRGLPRWVVLQESDKSLPVDLENALSVDALVHVLKRGSQATLTEMFPPPNRLCVSSVDGHFYHELNVPFVRKSRSEREAEDRTDPNLNTEGARIEVNLARERRTFPPGSEWLYVKLYGGPVSLDDILLRAVLPLVRGACQSGSVTGWFFIRYCDPQQHLRIRLRGAPERLHRQVLPLVFESFNPYLTSGKLWKIEFATYEREIERYGGLEGLIVSENVFFADSEAVLDILKESESQGDDSIRWRMALLGIDRLLCDCGLDDSEKIEAVDSWQASFHREFRVDNILKRQLSERFRTERGNFELLFDSHSLDEKWKMSKQALDQRSRQMTQAIRKLRELAAEGKLTVNIIHLAQSFAHMHVNRLIRSAQRSHELILYDFLVRIYRMRMARSIKVVSN